MGWEKFEFATCSIGKDELEREAAIAIRSAAKEMQKGRYAKAAHQANRASVFLLELTDDMERKEVEENGNDSEAR